MTAPKYGSWVLSPGSHLWVPVKGSRSQIPGSAYRSQIKSCRWRILGPGTHVQVPGLKSRVPGPNFVVRHYFLLQFFEDLSNIYVLPIPFSIFQPLLRNEKIKVNYQSTILNLIMVRKISSPSSLSLTMFNN